MMLHVHRKQQHGYCVEYFSVMAMLLDLNVKFEM